jgi:L-alanine-DL-glutamate epimerase-like enolase superfamily enzyme
VKIYYRYFQLQFRHAFHIAAGVRNTTDAVYVMLEQDGIKGYGEIALPPYLETKANDVIAFLSQAGIPENYNTGDFFSLLNKWNAISDSCRPALAALDIALHDFQGKMLNRTVRDLYNIKSDLTPFCAYTIGMCGPEEMKEKINEASGFQFFKLKLGGAQDQSLVNTFRSMSTHPFCVDANRGWNDVEASAEFCNRLAEEGCVFAEQPFEKNKLVEINELRSKTSLPVILDESVQCLADVESLKDMCDGINIKLVKCGGLFPAFQMIEKARSHHLKVFIGCMSEGTCGCGSAAQLAPLADWVDLDGPLLIANDPFSGLTYENGKIRLNDLPGSGMKPLESFLESWK